MKNFANFHGLRAVVRIRGHDLFPIRPPIEHVIRVRVLKAAEPLQRGDVRVTEAAFACGFKDSNYFSRQFRRIMGTSPRDYRNRVKQV